VHEGMHIRANDAYLEMFGFESFEDIEGMSLLDLVAPQHVEGFKQLLKRMGKGEPPPPRYELEARTADGEAFPAVMEFMPASYDDEPCLQVVFRRQEMDPELAREVEELRQRDQATGLYNRATFLRLLEGAVAEVAQEQRQHGLLLIEPDHYQRLLQDIGLDSSDRLIAALSEVLRDTLPDAAIAARFGEHTLAVLLREADHTATAALAERIREAFSTHVFAVDERSISLTASIGGVQIGERIASVTQVLAKASQGVQSALAVGGNRVELFDPGAVDRAEEERMGAWVARIRTAIDQDGFVLHYQPVIGLQGEPEAMYEALVRMGGPEDLVSPLAFLQIAEEHGMIGEIDRWVVGHAIAVIGERARQGERTTLFVKITQASLLDEEFAGFIGEALKKHGVPGELLVLELPEAKVFTHLRAAQALQGTMAGYGCRVGLEQFGSGLNSFQLLSHFDPAFLKIDRAFIEDLSRKPEHQQKVRDIAARAAEAGKLTIAEFVQDAASMSILFSTGVDYVQGQFLAPPGPEMNYEF
ncbi:MAG TPA: bifunctional diguanylate cyclase/phosphodiesterase, partial [Xanthomonadaceae bacterium]|nr:bifunctional diguanylate cyclase/phosphodiesterase [Xanthomonadaceae bacterium]